MFGNGTATDVEIAENCVGNFYYYTGGLSLVRKCNMREVMPKQGVPWSPYSRDHCDGWTGERGSESTGPGYGRERGE